MHKTLTTIALLAAAGTLAACSKPDQADTSVEKSVVVIDDAKSASTSKAVETEVTLNANTETGNISVDLPNGAGVSVKLPPEAAASISKGTNVDIDDIGLFPGARVTGVKAVSRKQAGAESSDVTLDFTAPAPPEAVAQWYVATLADKGAKSSRKGNRIDGVTREGSAFTLDLAADGKGTRGTFQLTDSKA